YVNTRLAEWKANGVPRRAGVSSFGIGGTNAHIIVEEAPEVEESGKSRPWQLLALSAKTSSALEAATENMVQYLKQHPDLDLADVAYTLHVGRRAFSHRRVLVCHDLDDAVSIVEMRNPQRLLTGTQEQVDRPVVFMFPGQGTQYVNMGLELYQSEPIFREWVDRCSKILQPLLGFDLRDLLYPSQERTEEPDAPAQRLQSLATSDASRRRGTLSGGQVIMDFKSLHETLNAQLALFVMEYALAQLWMAWGVRPQAMIGHSIGEYVAACLAGVLSLEDALALITTRGRLMQALPDGAMLAVPLPEEKINPILGSALSLAAINGLSLCVVSGPIEAVDALQEQLSEQGVATRRLHTSHAFHSAMMQPILASFTEQVKKVNLKAPKIPYVSNLTGTWISAAEAMDADYWARHLRQTVRFSEGLHELLKKPEQIFLEVGPGHTLSTLVRQHHEEGAGQTVLSSIRHPQERQSDVAFLLSTLGRLWLAGSQVDWPEVYAQERRHRLPLPTYPFERQRYWVEAQKQVHDESSRQVESTKKPGIVDWFYIPVWKQTALLKPAKTDEQEHDQHCWLVFVDECGLGSELLKRLEQDGQDVICVKVGEEFRRDGDGVYTIDPRAPEDYDALLRELRALNKTAKTIAHLWSVTEDGRTQAGSKFFEESQALGFYSLLFLAQALGRQNMTDALQIGVVTNNMQKVADEVMACPEKATIMGPCKVIPQEYPGIACRSIDIIVPEAAASQETELIDQLIAELTAKAPDLVVAYRKGQRWIQNFEPVQLDGSVEGKGRLRERGVYLISGGLGGMGLELAEYLAGTVRARLILVGRSALPERNEWERWLATHGDQDNTSHKIRRVQALEEAGAEVMVASADITNEEQMRKVITRAYDRFGEIHGVIHAAGVAGGGMIQLKTREKAEEVLAPKLRGLLVLDTIFKDVKLDFIVLCSSLTSILGDFGQVDYCAANAFLDGFAHWQTSKNHPFILSINWDTWQEVGMAVEAVEAAARLELQKMPHATQYEEVAHPLLEKRVAEEAEQAVYAAALSVKKDWVLDEHRMMGQALLPGTAYLEMARAAFENYAGSGTFEIGEAYFIAPLIVSEDEEKEVRTILTKDEAFLALATSEGIAETSRNALQGGFNFAIVSRSGPGEDGKSNWQEHARGKIVHLDMEPAKHYEIRQLEEDCNQETLAIPEAEQGRIERFKDTGPLVFGPRWKHLLKRVTIGTNQALAVLELPESFATDLESFKLHPALLDVATSFVVLDKEGVYLPFSYKGVKVNGPLPEKVYSYIRWDENNSTLHLNITIMDEQGTALVEVQDYTLRRADDTLFSAQTSPAVAVTREARSQEPAEVSSFVPKNQNFCLEISSPGNLDSLKLRATALRQPGPGEVEIEVYLTGLNFKDVLLALTASPDLPAHLTQFGSECVGKITAVGEGVEDFQIGDEVIAVTPGCFSAFVTTSATLVAPKPAHLSSEEAATIPIAFMTAHYALHHLAKLGKGERVLIHAATGGVGLAAVKLAQNIGAEIFATAGNPEKRAFLRSLAIEHVMDSRSLDFADEVMRRTDGKGVDVVLNSLAGEFQAKSLATLGLFGRFVEIGKRDILQNSKLDLRPFEKGLSFFAINLSPELPSFRSLLLEVTRYFKDGVLTPLPYRVFPIMEVVRAFNYMAQAKHIGKVVVSMQDPEVLVAAATGVPVAEHEDAAYSIISTPGGPGLQKKSVTATNILQPHLKRGILSKEGVEAFSRLLSSSFPQVVVSTQDLHARIEEHKALRAIRVLEELEKPHVSTPKHPRPLLGNAYVAPRNEDEQVLANILQEVLGVEQVGIHDNFFDLGGASLQSLQVMAKANDAGIQLTPELLFEYQTIAELVAMYDTLGLSQPKMQ
ncbi:MAG: SDR family NAD(P)-dependent oxidoreductase, partial [Ktedonobacteraceae bacterium]